MLESLKHPECMVMKHRHKSRSRVVAESMVMGIACAAGTAYGPSLLNWHVASRGQVIPNRPEHLSDLASSLDGRWNDLAPGMGVNYVTYSEMGTLFSRGYQSYPMPDILISPVGIDRSEFVNAAREFGFPVTFASFCVIIFGDNSFVTTGWPKSGMCSSFQQLPPILPTSLHIGRTVSCVLLWTVIVVLLRTVPGELIAARRRRRGMCSRCGYPLMLPNSRCSECGAVGGVDRGVA